MPRWNSCNILHVAADANCLWQFDAKGGLNRELRAGHTSPLPGKFIAKSWTSLWQPKLNVAWLPLEHIFLRVVELPKSNFEETVAMVELQLEKLSPIPVTQIVWTIHMLPQSVDNLQTVIVVIAERSAVEEFLGRLEGKNFLADRLEAPMLDQLEATPATEDGAWIYPSAMGNPHAALVAWWSGGVLRNVSFVVLPAEGDRAANLKSQLVQLGWAGELEGWLTAQPAWHLVAEGAAVGEWDGLLQQALGEPVKISPPLGAADLAARTAKRATQTPQNIAAALLPAEFSNRYREQFHDRLWLHGLFAVGILYVICVAIYFCGTTWQGYQTGKVEQQVANLKGDYTKALQLKARYAVLQERQNLKFAALDCWKLVADNLPEGLTLQRFSFGNGQTLTLAGTTTKDQINTLFNFNSALQKAKLHGKPVFDPLGSEPVNPRTTGDKVTWSFSLKLQHGEKVE